MHAVLSTVSIYPSTDINHTHKPIHLSPSTPGVSRAGLIDWLTVQDFRWVMEVNFFAVVSVTKAFLPSLKKVRRGARGWMARLCRGISTYHVYIHPVIGRINDHQTESTHPHSSPTTPPNNQ